MPSRPSETAPDGEQPTTGVKTDEAAEAPAEALTEASARNASTVEVSTDEDARGVEALAGDASAGGAPTAGRARRVRVLVTLGVAAVLLLAGTAVLAVGYVSTSSSGANANAAYVDSAATAEVVGQVTDAVTTVYSYDYNSLAANEAAAKSVVTGKFADEFARVFEPVKQLAPGQLAVLRTTVPAAGVSLLEGDRARLLMMVDQNGTRGAAKEPTGATARLVVDAQKIDGRWKISEVTPE